MTSEEQLAIQEKAKAYDEALERAKAINNEKSIERKSIDFFLFL